jgi:mono/diheme cytochrome c family protein
MSGRNHATRTMEMLMLRSLTLLASALLLLSNAAVGCVAERQSPPLAAAATALNGEQLIGQRVYMRACNGCHPQGAGGLGPALNDKPVPAAAIKLQVRQGIGAMPSFSEQEISSQELAALVAFMSATGSPWGG